MCCGAKWVLHWRLLARPMLITWRPWIGNEPCTMGPGRGRSCKKSVSKSICTINVVACNSSPQVITSGGHRQMHGKTLLFWPMSVGWHDTWIPRCSILPKRRMCGGTATMPACLHGGVVYGDILHGMQCFNCVAQLRGPTGAHLATAIGMLEARLQKVAQEEGQGWLQFKAQTATGAWHGVQLVQFDSGGQKCATTPPFPGVQARVVTDVLLAGIKEGQATIDPRGVLECAVLLDHALPVSERAAYGVHRLRQFMASHQEELRAAHVNSDGALVEWEGLKEHTVQHCANVQTSKIWEAWAVERAHVQWVNVWRVLALLRTYCPIEAAIERAISLCGRLCSSMQDIVEKHVLSMCMALHSNPPHL